MLPTCPSSDVWFENISCGLSFHSPAHSSHRSISPNFNQAQLTSFSLPHLVLLVFYWSTLVNWKSQRFFSCFFFFVFHFIFRSLVHFELVFCVRWEIWVKKNKPPEKLLQVSVQELQHYLLKRQFLSLPNCLCMFASSQLIIFTWVYFWFLYPFHWSIYLCFHWYRTLLFIMS